MNMTNFGSHGCRVRGIVRKVDRKKGEIPSLHLKQDCCLMRSRYRMTYSHAMYYNYRRSQMSFEHLGKFDENRSHFEKPKRDFEHLF